MEEPSMDLEHEKRVVEKAKYDPEAFSLLYQENYDRILNYAVRRTGNVEISKDIVSETFCKAFKNLRMFQWRNIPFSAWLYRICNNEINGYFRKGRYRAVSLEQLIEDHDIQLASDDNPEDEITQAQKALQQNEQFLYFQQRISEMPIKYQEVLSLRYFEEKSLKEIAVILGKSEGTIKSLLHRGIEKLKKLVL